MITPNSRGITYLLVYFRIISDVLKEKIPHPSIYNTIFFITLFQMKESDLELSENKKEEEEEEENATMLPNYTTHFTFLL